MGTLDNSGIRCELIERVLITLYRVIRLSRSNDLYRIRFLFIFSIILKSVYFFKVIYSLFCTVIPFSLSGYIHTVQLITLILHLINTDSNR